ncbi:hypothetical protein SISSUDRAFT_215352 [Sistotremastrum suecicum HHB10207 ss-3]|uniref:Uncharacterized protein n=1 Tax=Sistotremastrum suecicum HHB10207 ss-3 TaxID=1314776 RepID=A0A166A706_9AGAM|nr:hypothetical protein SISSUDRAFT_215352 [Sistotremastrum suecicum HHB10207 ss-3]
MQVSSFSFRARTCSLEMLNCNWRTEGANSLLRKLGSRLMEEKNHLINAFSGAIADISERSNLYTQIARLPEELVLRIFTQASDEWQKIRALGPIFPYIVDHPPSFSQWTNVLKVCRSWHNTVISFSPAWGSIDMSWPSEAIETHLRLSKSAPLRV